MMAVLPETDRQQIWAHAMRGTQAIGCVAKADLKAAVDAVDDWIEDNTVSYNAALPNPFKTAATTTEKYFLLMYVVMRRMGCLHVEGD